MNISLSKLVPVRSDTFFGSMHTILVDMTYHKLSHMAYRRHLKNIFDKLTKDLNFREIEEKLLKLKNEIPPKVSMYETIIYASEILSLTFGIIENDERAKRLIEDITIHASKEDLMDLNIKKWDLVKNRLESYVSEAIKLLLEENYNETQAYYIITYIQGLMILIRIIDKYKRLLLKKRWDQYKDISDAMDLIAKFLLLSLLTAKYIDGDLTPENYMYSMEYVSEVFVKEEDSENESRNIESLVIMR